MFSDLELQSLPGKALVNIARRRVLTRRFRYESEKN